MVYKTIITILILFILPFTAHAWEKDYIEALEKGLEMEQNTSEGLGYTQPKNDILYEAIEKALNEEAYPCEVLKIAVDMEYDAYFTIKYIYALGKELNIDQLCMCAIEAGIQQHIIAMGASDATLPGTEEPVFYMDEIAQSQCLRSQRGLAYTENQEPQVPLVAIRGPDSPDGSFSPSSFDLDKD